MRQNIVVVVYLKYDWPWASRQIASRLIFIHRMQKLLRNSGKENLSQTRASMSNVHRFEYFDACCIFRFGGRSTFWNLHLNHYLSSVLIFILGIIEIIRSHRDCLNVNAQKTVEYLLYFLDCQCKTLEETCIGSCQESLHHIWADSILLQAIFACSSLGGSFACGGVASRTLSQTFCTRLSFSDLHEVRNIILPLSRRAVLQLSPHGLPSSSSQKSQESLDGRLLF